MAWTTEAGHDAVAGAAPASADATDGLQRRLGFWATTAVVVGTIIGSGIFRVPATIAAETGSVTGSCSFGPWAGS